MKRLDYKDLPSELSSEVSNDGLITAYLDDENDDRIIVWIFDKKINRAKELEYSISGKKTLSRKERETTLPKEKKILYPNLGVEVVCTSYLEHATDQLHEKFDIYTIRGGDKITSISRVFFTPYRCPIEQEVKEAIEEAEFESEYPTWSNEEKISYWACSLYRLRRQTNEYSPDKTSSIFSQNLIEKIRKKEPNIDLLMTKCLQKLAFLEQVSEKGLICEFEKEMKNKE